MRHASAASTAAGSTLAALTVLGASTMITIASDTSAATTSMGVKIVCPFDAVAVPAGAFPIGTRAMQDYDDDERPRHTVQLTHAYCLDRTEVTVVAYGRCVAAGKCVARKAAFAGEDMPMTNVSWSDARAACWFRGGRLPTEVEWEHAARGTDDRLYPWGSWRPQCMYADAMYEMWGHCNGYGPSPVGSFPSGASPYGALDLAGNVLEWVDDAWSDDAWKRLGTVDPRDDDPKAPHHVVRGGGWEWDVVHSLRVSDRDGYPTTLRDATLGFRCAYDVSSSPPP
ncbi:MAG: SUMF1/EgtB/PvdO family nonheme iron enzyme [Polyangiales bacterium]